MVASITSYYQGETSILLIGKVSETKEELSHIIISVILFATQKVEAQGITT